MICTSGWPGPDSCSTNCDAMGNWYTDDVKYIAGVGEMRAKLLQKELDIATVGDLLYHFPFRYIDRSEERRVGKEC